MFIQTPNPDLSCVPDKEASDDKISIRKKEKGEKKSAVDLETSQTPGTV